MFGYDLVTVLVVLIAIVVLAKPIIKLIDFAGAIAIGICGVIVAAVVLIIGGFVWLWKRLNVRKVGRKIKADKSKDDYFNVFMTLVQSRCELIGHPISSYPFIRNRYDAGATVEDVVSEWTIISIKHKLKQH